MGPKEMAGQQAIVSQSMPMCLVRAELLPVGCCPAIHAQSKVSNEVSNKVVQQHDVIHAHTRGLLLQQLVLQLGGACSRVLLSGPDRCTIVKISKNADWESPALLPRAMHRMLSFCTVSVRALAYQCFLQWLHVLAVPFLLFFQEEHSRSICAFQIKRGPGLRHPQAASSLFAAGLRSEIDLL